MNDKTHPDMPSTQVTDACVAIYEKIKASVTEHIGPEDGNKEEVEAFKEDLEAFKPLFVRAAMDGFLLGTGTQEEITKIFGQSKGTAASTEEEVNVALVVFPMAEDDTTKTLFSSFLNIDEALGGIKSVMLGMPAEVSDNVFIIIGKKQILEYFHFGKIADTDINGDPQNVH